MQTEHLLLATFADGGFPQAGQRQPFHFRDEPLRRQRRQRGVNLDHQSLRRRRELADQLQRLLRPDGRLAAQ